MAQANIYLINKKNWGQRGYYLPKNTKPEWKEIWTQVSWFHVFLILPLLDSHLQRANILDNTY